MNVAVNGHRQRGVSLIEALVALAVMAFGMLGVAGMQATLRSNADVAKQRAEAVRISQAAVEDWRAFEEVTAAGVADFDADIISSLPAAVSGLSTNTTFEKAATVTPTPTVPASDPKLKTVNVELVWKDRADRENRVRLVTAIARIAPELAGSLGLPSDRAATQRPKGRNPAIPVAAVDQNNGTSDFTPPGAPSGTTWVFNNNTGVITQVCTPVCVADSRFLLSGFVLFATGTVPTAAEGEFPVDPLPGGPFALGIAVRLSVPSIALESCFTHTDTLWMSYYCALPTTTVTSSSLAAHWSGLTEFTGPTLTTSTTFGGDNSTTNHKVCRYTTVPTNTPATGDNRSHPLLYDKVYGPLTQQNYLVITAGDGTTSFDCPADGPLPFVNSTTYRHQPSV